jgi:hypothetical protein
MSHIYQVQYKIFSFDPRGQSNLFCVCAVNLQTGERKKRNKIVGEQIFTSVFGILLKILPPLWLQKKKKNQTINKISRLPLARRGFRTSFHSFFTIAFMAHHKMVISVRFTFT